MSNKILSTKKYFCNAGFTLLETLIAMSILLIVFVLGSNYIITGFKSFAFGSEQEEAISTARRSLEIMTKEIRGANNSNQGEYPIQTMDSNDFIFFSDIEYDGDFEKVRYFLDGTDIKKTVTEPGSSNDYSGIGVTTIIGRYVNNQDESIFSYYDRDYTETTDLDSVRLIHIVLKINVTPERAPNDYYVETDVHLRNLKDNL